MEIRRAQHSDLVPVVEDLWFPFAREMAETNSYHELARDSRQPALEYRERLLERDNVAMWVAVAGDEYVGLATVERQASPPVFTRGDSAHIHEIYVDPAYRGEGLSQRLLDRIGEMAAEWKCEYLTLDVDIANERAREFYRNAGFEPKRERWIRHR